MTNRRGSVIIREIPGYALDEEPPPEHQLQVALHVFETYPRPCASCGRKACLIPWTRWRRAMSVTHVVTGVGWR